MVSRIFLAVTFLVVLFAMQITPLRAADAESARLTTRQGHIITVAAFAAIGDAAKLKSVLSVALNGDLSVNEIREILIQLYAYCGFPRSLNAINALIEVLDERQAMGIRDQYGRDASDLPLGYDANAYGNHVRNQLLGMDLTHNPAPYARFAPVIDDYLKAHLFGDIFARDLLSYQDRELVTISALATQENTDSQLQAHLGIIQKNGISAAQLDEFVLKLRADVSEQVAERVNGILHPGQQNNTGQGTTAKIFRNSPENISQGPAGYFTGRVLVESRFSADDQKSYIGAMVNFATGARTAWHSHPRGQTLLVTAGKGRVQIQGQPVQQIETGDVVWIPANQRHWHGAAPDSAMSHVAMVSAKDGVTTHWMEHVSDEVYLSPLAPQVSPD